MNSFARVMKAGITIPDFRSISKRSIALPRHILSTAVEPVASSLSIPPDSRSTAKTNGTRKNMTFPLGAPGASSILRSMKIIKYWRANSLHWKSVTPPPFPICSSELSRLLMLSSDGTYDGEPVSQAVLDKQPDAQVVIPPHKSAVCSGTGDTQRDQHIQIIAQQGRIAWQRITGYNLRNYTELAMKRYKRILGNTMKSRELPQQKTEVWISVFALNRMTNLGMLVSVKI